MAVAVRNVAWPNINASTASTTLTFLAPQVVTAGDLWICMAAFRAGSTVTISGVPASFHLIKRTDSGSATTNVTIVSYWYVATGAETTTASFATITISASSKYVTFAEAVTGCNMTTPQVGTVVSAVGTTGTITTGALAALTTGQLAFGVSAQQGLSGVGVQPNSNDGLQTHGQFAASSGGSAATNVGLAEGWLAASTDAISQTWNTNTATQTTLSLGVHAFILDAAPAARPLPVTMISQAVNRSASY